MDSGIKRRETFRLVIRAQFKASLMCGGGISVYGTGSFHIWKGSIRVEG